MNVQPFLHSKPVWTVRFAPWLCLVGKLTEMTWQEAETMGFDVHGIQ